MSDRSATPSERFSRRFVVADNGCWEWNGGRNWQGYGRLSVDGKFLYAHRWGYEHLVGPIPDGLVIDHLCRNRGCVNPDHMEPVTIGKNVQRGDSPTALAARTNRCPTRNHDLSLPGAVYEHRGRRQCRECNHLRGVEKAKRQKAARRAARMAA